MLRVLLIDDDVGTIEVFGFVLRQSNCEVASAPSGQLGLRVAARFKPHVSAIDLRLPDMSGIDVFRELRDKNPAATVIVVSAFATCRSAVEATAKTMS